MEHIASTFIYYMFACVKKTRYVLGGRFYEKDLASSHKMVLLGISSYTLPNLIKDSIEPRKNIIVKLIIYKMIKSKN